ncbi:MAG: hypothetical protein QOH12_3927, partial [Solirubrobacteraceae bacterium]|nr:hypothetical protein [Solirubrobacteraceae bacterium]
VFARAPVPYLLLLDDFARPGAAPALYEQLFHTPPPTAVGRGTADIRMTVDFGGHKAHLTLMPLGRPAEIDEIDFSAAPQPPFASHKVVRLRRRGGHVIMATLVVPHAEDSLPDVSGEVDDEAGTVTVNWSFDGRAGVDVLSFAPADPVPASFMRDGVEPAGTEILLPASVPTPPPAEDVAGLPGSADGALEAPWAAGGPAGPVAESGGVGAVSPQATTTSGAGHPGARRSAATPVIERLGRRFAALGHSRSAKAPAATGVHVAAARAEDPAAQQPAVRTLPAEPGAGAATRSAADAAITPSRQRRLRRLVEGLEEMRGDSDYPTPPERGVVMGNADFKTIGAEFLDHFVAFADLDPDADVLDAGCGGGRMAAALLYYLRYGSYTGFDVHEESIDWCREALVPRNPRFTFDHVDLHNGLYRPDSSLDASVHRFPYEDERFDFVIATSLFTHMFRDEVRNYLGEFRRVLRPGGVGFVTAYLLNPDSILAMLGNERSVKFGHVHRDSGVLDPERAADGVAHTEEWLRADARAQGLSVDRIAYGAWTGHERLSKQDVVLLRRDL